MDEVADLLDMAKCSVSIPGRQETEENYWTKHGKPAIAHQASMFATTSTNQSTISDSVSHAKYDDLLQRIN